MRNSRKREKDKSRMLDHYALRGTKTMLFAGVLAGSISVLGVRAQSPSDVSAGKPSAVAAPSHYQPNRISRHAVEYYGFVWGVGSLSVKSVESGEIIRFSYHVIDADKAKPLNDKKADPLLIDPQAGVKLVVPSLEKVGQLRQSSTPEAGKSYWMAFSNKGRTVKRGDRVNIVIGLFHADGLFVE
jgi:hypothetical protein